MKKLIIQNKTTGSILHTELNDTDPEELFDFKYDAHKDETTIYAFTGKTVLSKLKGNVDEVKCADVFADNWLWLRDAEICSVCGTVCGIEDECYEDMDSHKPLCDSCSVFDEVRNGYVSIPPCKEFNFETYTRNPETKEGGWDIMHLSVVAETRDLAKLYLEQWDLFDCVILQNFSSEVKRDKSGKYILDESTSVEKGCVIPFDKYANPQKYGDVLFEADTNIETEETELPDLISKYGFYVIEASNSMQELEFVSRHKSLKEARVAGVKHAFQYSETEPEMNSNPLTEDGRFEEVWVGEMEDGYCHADVGVVIIKGSYVLAKALLDYRHFEGKDWVEKLCDAWDTGLYDSKHKEYQHLLQRFRNEVDGFDLEDIDADTTAEDISIKLDELESQDNDEFNEL